MMLRALALAAALSAHAACGSADRAPRQPLLSDQQFWDAIVGLSETPGHFEPADNLVSNETQFVELIASLDRRGGAYLGVGPEQNFTYMARLEPALAFIVDIRQDNRNLHLMYKALFEIAQDRADFVARLFSRERPPGAGSGDSVDELFDAVSEQPPSTAALDSTLALVRQRLVDTHRFALAPEDLHSIETAIRAFHQDGPEIRYGRSMPPSETRPSYRRLMTGRDHRGVVRSYLASEHAFAYLKQLQMANRVVPVVGDFAGPHALRRVGEFIRQHGEIVTGVYASNVEVYLTRDERRTFCGHLATLPSDDETVFIGNRRLLTLPAKLAACAAIRPSLRWP